MKTNRFFIKKLTIFNNLKTEGEKYVTDSICNIMNFKNMIIVKLMFYHKISL